MSVRSCVAAVALLGLWPAYGEGQVELFDSTDAVSSFQAMAEYLARDGGRWIAPNPNYNGAENSPTHFGLWFEQDARNHFLELKIVAHFPDQVLTSSRGHWAWHPTRGQLTHVMVDRGGGLSEGVTTYPSATVFVTTSIRSGVGGRSESRDENVIISDDVHRNTSFHRDENEWVETGVYEWTRTSGR